MYQPLSMNGNAISNISLLPITDDEVTSKQYVDNSIAGASFLPAATKLNQIATSNATTANIDMNTHKLVNLLQGSLTTDSY